MELKPIKENYEISYPTISNIENNVLDNTWISSSEDDSSTIPIIPIEKDVIICVYAPSYIALNNLANIRNGSFLVIAFFLILLVLNQMKLKKDELIDASKLKKHNTFVKISEIFLIISMIVAILTMILLSGGHLEAQIRSLGMTRKCSFIMMIFFLILFFINNFKQKKVIDQDMLANEKITKTIKTVWFFLAFSIIMFCFLTLHIFILDYWYIDSWECVLWVIYFIVIVLCLILLIVNKLNLFNTNKIKVIEITNKIINICSKFLKFNVVIFIIVIFLNILFILFASLKLIF